MILLIKINIHGDYSLDFILREVSNVESKKTDIPLKQCSESSRVHYASYWECRPRMN